MSTETNPLVFLVNPVTLQEIAVVQVAVGIWHREVTKFPNNVDRSSRFLENAFPCAKDFAKVPKTLEKLIDQYIGRMKISLCDWVEYHYRKIVSPYETKYLLLKYFDKLAWRSYAGTIDYKQTAVNFVTKSDLGIGFKHRFACLYCLEEYVRELWPKLQINGSTQVAENEMYAVSYWDKRMRNETVDPALFEWLETSVDSWPQIFYFWSLLKPEDKAEGTIKVVTLYYSSSYARRLLPLLTKTQLDAVLRECPLVIMGSLAFAPEDAEYTLQTWRYLSNMISVTDFVYVYRLLLNPPYLFIPLIPTILYKMWQDSPEKLKNFVLTEYSSFVTETLEMLLKVRVVLVNLSGDVRFIMELLRLKNSTFRRDFWHNNWIDVIAGIGSAQLNKLIKLCLETDEEVAQFKKTEVVYKHIAQYCLGLVREGLFKELNEFLLFCSTDQTTVNDLKRKLIWSQEMLVNCVMTCNDTAEMDKFEEFLAGIFADPDCRRSVKRHMVISPVMLAYSRDGLNSDHLRPIKNFVQVFSTRKDDLEIVKNCFAQHCRSILNRTTFQIFIAEEWNEFLMWCFDNNQNKLEEFKKSIPFDNIYQSMFHKCVNRIPEKLGIGICRPLSNDRENEVAENQRDLNFSGQVAINSDATNTSIMFNLLDNFLSWYFVTKEKVDEFKLEKAKAVQPDHPCGGLINSKNANLAEAVLEWFLNGDKEQIEKYKMKLL